MATKFPNSASKLPVDSGLRRLWVDPVIRELNVSETFAFPGVGGDVGGNPDPDCQRS